MAYDEGLAQRIRETLGEQAGLVEKKMFGGVAFMVNGHMACGVNKEALIVRVGPDRYDQALEHPYTQQFGPAGRPMTGWVTVAAEGYGSDEELKTWLQQGLDFARSLPPK